MGMLLTGRRVPAAEGQRLGFVNEVVPKGEALAFAKRWAAQILECAPLSVRASKQAAYQGLEVGLAEAMSGHYGELRRMVKSEDFVEGPKAFAEKRPPRWKGR
jgi:crotonobetainyl-CoA hydratase